MAARAILLMGPTGAGKSDAALALAMRLPLEIISVDATLVYQGLDIGSAKPTREERARVPHHLIDICDPTERYSVGEFLRDVGPLIAGIRERGAVPLLVGGTMLYYRALQSGLARLPPADPSIRAELTARAAVEGWPALHADLVRIDPEAAARIAPRDGQRIQRALEVERLTGTPLSRLQREDLKRGSDTDYLKLVLAPEQRAALDERLAGRFDRMLAAGFLEEVRALHARGDLDADLPALRAVGYRQLWPVVTSGAGLDEARAAAIHATRQLAKRQYTWLRAEPEARWIDPGLDGGVAALEAAILAGWSTG
jgi:tRNA dimethylallyltransferase